MRRPRPRLRGQANSPGSMPARSFVSEQLEIGTNPHCILTCSTANAVEGQGVVAVVASSTKACEEGSVALPRGLDGGLPMPSTVGGATEPGIGSEFRLPVSSRLEESNGSFVVRLQFGSTKSEGRGKEVSLPLE